MKCLSISKKTADIFFNDILFWICSWDYRKGSHFVSATFFFARKVVPFMPYLSQAPKILIIRFSSIGDIVLTTPVVRCLKQQLQAEVHFLTKKAFQGVLSAHPGISKVYAIEKKVGEVLSQLRGESYDYIIDLHHNLRSWQVKWALRGVPSSSFDKLNFEKWLLVRLGINRLPAAHIVDRYLAAAAPLGVSNDGGGLDYFIPADQELDAAAWLRAAGIAEPLPYIAFVTGAAHATKRLPAEQIAAICRQIKLPVVLLGGPDESETGDFIAGRAGAHVVNACGKLKLHQSASMVRQASQVITHDTGLMHVAAAFQKDIISIWGNTVPEFGMYPYYPQGIDRNTTVEVKGLTCRPCSKIGYDTCPKGHFQCMRNINPEFVAGLINF